MAASPKLRSRRSRKTSRPTTPQKNPGNPLDHLPSRVAVIPLTFNHQDIARRAYAIWRQQGCPQGQAPQHWRQAENELTVEALAQR